ncbi:maleylacetoacetate isomerase [Thalassospira sp.]|uniref:maleylacetoacetate isomerase n=1 Tax=Thalassospira sp. TaxID=1912094 RepID=UPI0027343F8C|nr:maleylacetoacetate isomerase [Thalassospira sp.]MDP2700241.1 maleylacetoacetate isomerase [Thalassospira sp.]
MSNSSTVFYDYWRSSASYRVRIALNMLGMEYRTVPVDLLTGQHRTPGHLARNPQGFVPALEIDGHLLTQSVAIIEYLNDTRPGCGFLPADPVLRHHVRALAHVIAMDIHPVCNLAVVRHVMALVEDGEAVRDDWMVRFIFDGLRAFETMLDQQDGPVRGAFCCGDAPTLADFCLIPQLYNAERWHVDVTGLSRIGEIAAACATIPAFQAAHPDRVKPG